MSVGPNAVKAMAMPPEAGSNEPRSPGSTMRHTMSLGPNLMRQQGRAPGSSSPKSTATNQQQVGTKRLLCMATETVDLQMLCLQQDEGEKDSFFTCKLEADPTQAVKGYLHNPKVFCPCYLGKTAQQYIRPQATLGFRYANGEVKLVCLSIIVPRGMA